MRVELSKFRVIKGKEELALEWMAFLNEHKEEVLETLEGEKMYIETIFKEHDGEYLYLYWYSVQGEGGIEVRQSEFEVDKKHVEYWQSCIDKSYKSIDMEAEVIMIPKRVIQSF